MKKEKKYFFDNLIPKETKPTTTQRLIAYLKIQSFIVTILALVVGMGLNLYFRYQTSIIAIQIISYICIITLLSKVSFAPRMNILWYFTLEIPISISLLILGFFMFLNNFHIHEYIGFFIMAFFLDFGYLPKLIMNYKNKDGEFAN